MRAASHIACPILMQAGAHMCVKTSKGVHSATYFVDKADETKGNWGSLYCRRFSEHLECTLIWRWCLWVMQPIVWHKDTASRVGKMHLAVSLSLLWAMVQKIFLWTRQRPLMINASRAKTFEHLVHMHEQYHLFSYMHTNKLRETERCISASNFSSHCTQWRIATMRYGEYYDTFYA